MLYVWFPNQKMTFQMSEYSLSVDDKALHPVLLSDDISRPDIITKRDRENAHISDTFNNCFDKDEDILYSVCTRKGCARQSQLCFL